jgi:phage/plasmid-like protein (TIGR03299 family)
MAHNLYTKDGVTSAAYATDLDGLPWHKLGQMVDGAMTWPEAVQLSKIGFTVKKVPLFIQNPLWTPGSSVPKGFKVPDQFAVIRTDVNGEESILGIVGSQYEITQNVEIGGWIDKILGQIDGAHYEAVGVLGKGERVWAAARIPFDINLGNDQHQMYLVFTGSHNGSSSSTLFGTDTRVVCNNTLTFALSHATKELCLKVRHTKNAKERLDHISTELHDSLKKDVMSMEDKFKRLIDKKVSPEMFVETMTKLFGEEWLVAKKRNIQSAKVARIAELFKDNDKNAFPEQANTGMALVNAITNHTDHERTTRITKSSGYANQEQARAASAMMGTGAQFKTEALDVVLEMVDAPQTNPNPSVQMNKKSETVDRILDLVS